MVDSFVEYVWRFSDAVLPHQVHLAVLFCICVLKLNPMFRSRYPLVEIVRVAAVAFEVVSIALDAFAQLSSTPRGTFAQHCCRYRLDGPPWSPPVSHPGGNCGGPTVLIVL